MSIYQKEEDNGMEVDEIRGRPAPLRIKQPLPPKEFHIPPHLQEQIDKALDEKVNSIKYDV